MSPALQTDSSPLNHLGSPDLCIFDRKGTGKQTRRRRLREGRRRWLREERRRTVAQLVRSGGEDGAGGGEKDPGVWVPWSVLCFLCFYPRSPRLQSASEHKVRSKQRTMSAEGRRLFRER